MSNHGYLGYAIIVNKRFWGGLPEDVRADLNKAMMEASDLANPIAKDHNDAALAARVAGNTTEFSELTADERAVWIEALVPVQDEMA